jgi:hypothetical protein
VVDHPPTPIGKRASLLLCLVLLVTACSRGPSISAIPVYRNTPGPSPATSGEIAVAAQGFRAALGTYNKAIQAALRLRGNGATLAQQTDYYAALAAAEARFQNALDAIPFPAALAIPVKALKDASVVLRNRELRAAKARSLGSLASLAVQVQSADNRAADAAALLREALGLPPACRRLASACVGSGRLDGDRQA